MLRHHGVADREAESQPLAFAHLRRSDAPTGVRSDAGCSLATEGRTGIHLHEMTEMDVDSR
jgi:hypothetical protein